jgi:hypothetical protein
MWEVVDMAELENGTQFSCAIINGKRCAMLHAAG